MRSSSHPQCTLYERAQLTIVLALSTLTVAVGALPVAEHPNVDAHLPFALKPLVSEFTADRELNDGFLEGVHHILSGDRFRALPEQYLKNITSCEDAPQRECSGDPSERRSVVALPWLHHAAGLSDRIFFINAAAFLADALCARLEVPKPHDWLAAAHNNGVSVNPKWWWDRYISFAFQAPLDIPDTRSAPDGAVEDVNSDPNTVGSDYDQLATLDSRTVFRWNIKTKYFNWKLQGSTIEKCFHEIQPQLPLMVQPSTRVANLADRAARALQGGQPKMSTLHIRRGDTINECDTSIDAVLEYMRCTDKAWNTTATDALAIFTDETDQNYIDQVLGQLSAFPRWGGGVKHGDAVVKTQCETFEDSEDNYLIFMAEKTIVARYVTTHYEVRKCSGEVRCEAYQIARQSDRLAAAREPPL